MKHPQPNPHLYEVTPNGSNIPSFSPYLNSQSEAVLCLKMRAVSEEAKTSCFAQ